MDRNTKILLISLSTIIVGSVGYIFYVKKRNEKIYSDLMNSLNLNTGLTGTIADLKENDPMSAFNVSTWAWLVKGGKMKLDDFNLKTGLSLAQQISDSNDEKAVNLLQTIPTKAQFSYISYHYLKDVKKDKKTLLQRVNDMNSGYSTIIMNYVKSIPDK